MKKSIAIFIILSALAGVLLGCNSSDTDYNTEYYYWKSTEITSFSLKQNENVLSNLDSVFFTIDLDNARIFNADSLPVGTRVSALLVEIGYRAASAVELIFPYGDGDTIVNFMENPEDSIDFSKGPVTLRIKSYDGQVTRDYSLSVNVHKMQPDSLWWNEMAKRPLPTALASVSAQKTVETAGHLVCLTTNGSDFSVYACENPYSATAADDPWTAVGASLPAGAVVESLAGTTDAIYILDAAGSLFKSTDLGASWTSTGQSGWQHIYGGYGSTLMGVERRGSELYAVTFPASSEQKIEGALADMPVSGTSLPVSFVSDWSISPISIILGGRTASGQLTGSTWAFDGSTWANISLDGVYPKVEGAVMFPYFTYRTNTLNWSVTEFTCWMAFGGRDAEGKNHKDVYLSLDMGMHWHRADSMAQMPDYMPELNGAQALLVDQTMKPSGRGSGSVWTMMPSRRIPGWWVPEMMVSSRVEKPVTQWECPYIYLFGGYTADNRLNTDVWRGVLNRLSFKPIQ